MENNQKKITTILIYSGLIFGLVWLVLFLSFNEQQAQNNIGGTDINQQLEKYPTVDYVYGANLKEIYSDPLNAIYVYVCPPNSGKKPDLMMAGGISIEKTYAKINNNAVQRIFIFDYLPDMQKFNNVQNTEDLINAIAQQKPIVGFNRIKQPRYNYYNQSFVYDKQNKKFIFYEGTSYTDWTADSALSGDLIIITDKETGFWDYKKKTDNQVKTQKANNQTLENSPALQAQYKAEIEKTINIETAKAKKEIDKIYQEADDLYNNIIMTNGYNMENLSTYQIYSHSCEGPVFDVYFKLMNITEKYTGKHKELQTGWYGALANYIEPIMKKYNVSNLNKLSELESYMAEKSNEIETRAKGLYKTMNGEN